jgi:peptide/nickel transport system substrate-binding protein
MKQSSTKSGLFRKLSIGLGLALAVSTVGVTGSNAATGPVRGGKVTVLIGDPMNQYCPNDNGGNGSLHTFRMVYEPLLEQTAGGKLVPYLAESVTSTDNKVWIIKVRKDIKFHNGELLNAASVIQNFTVQRGLGALIGSKAKQATLKGAFAGNWLSVDPVDAMTVKVTLSVAQRDFAEVLYASGRNSMLAPAQLLSGTTCSSVPIGTGPFMVKGASTANETVFVKNPTYWRNAPDGKPLPYLDQITVKYVPEGSQRSTAVRTTKSTASSFTSSTGAKQVAALKKDGKVKIFTSPAEYYTTAWFNTQIAPFNQKNCRVAAAYALDPVKTAKIGTKGLDTPLDGLFAKGSLMYVKSPYSFNLAKAKEAFALCKADLKVATVSVAIPAGVDSAAKDYAQLSVNQLKAAGFDATVEQMLAADQIARAFAYPGTLQVNTLQIMEGKNTSAWNTTFLKSSTNPPGSPAQAALDAAVPGGLIGTKFKAGIWPLLNLAKHSNASIDAALFAAQAATDNATMKAKLREGVKIFQDEAYAVGGAALTYYYATSPNIKGIEDFRLLGGARTQLVSNWGFMWTTAYLTK